MSSTNTLTKIINGVPTPYTPLSLDGEKLFPNTEVIMPEPNDTDAWNVGGFVGFIAGCDEQTGDLIVVDASDDYWAVEPDRVIVDDQLDDDVIAGLELRRDKEKAVALAEAEALELAAEVA